MNLSVLPSNEKKMQPDPEKALQIATDSPPQQKSLLQKSWTKFNKGLKLISTVFLLYVTLFLISAYRKGAFIEPNFEDPSNTAPLCIVKQGESVKPTYPFTIDGFNGYSNKSLCPLSEKHRTHAFLQTSFRVLFDKDFREESALKLSGAVQVDTWIDDDNNDFTKFAKFHDYLETQFSKVFKKANVTKVNKWGLVLEFPGLDTTLKPLLLMAHQDTVPLGELNAWTHPPLGGYYDGLKVHGRGSSDCKNLLIGLLEAMDLLLVSEQFTLTRTVILAFGFDEESNGNNGAKEISKFLTQKYGENSMHLIIDEGPSVFQEIDDHSYGFIATVEKGELDIVVEVLAPGGHSSMPPAHTSIGIISQFLASYEREQFQPILSKDNPMLNMMQCFAEHTNLPESLKRDILRAEHDPISNGRVLDYLKSNPLSGVMVQTTQALDVIMGGEKSNSLPQNTTAVINHRIVVGESSQTVWDKVSRHATIVANENDIGLSLNGKTIYEPTLHGTINIRTKSDLAVAPVSPLYDDIWEHLTGTLRYFYEDIVYREKFHPTDEEKGSESKQDYFFVSPGLLPANTDTRHFWPLTDHIFRMQPGFTGTEAHIHDVNEYVDFDSHLQVIAFYYNYIMDSC